MLGSNIGSYCPQGPTLWPIWPEISWSGDVWPGFFALPSRFVQVKNWLVVSTYPSEKWWSSSMGRMTSHIWNGKSKPCLKPPTRKYLPFGKPPFSRTSPDTLSWHPTVKSYTWWRHFWTLGHGRKVPRHHSFRTFGRELRTTPQIKQEILNFLVLAWPSTFHNGGNQVDLQSTQDLLWHCHVSYLPMIDPWFDPSGSVWKAMISRIHW